MNAKIQNFDTICKLFPEKFANERKKVTLSKQVSLTLHAIQQTFTAKVTLSSVFANFYEKNFIIRDSPLFHKVTLRIFRVTK